MHKKTFSNKQKKAFSLIELSIVLIIIGLLVAGVTGGASLIQSATVRSVMSEVRGYRTSVNAFYDRYNFLPGDCNVAVGAGSPGVGNANGQITYSVGSAGASSLLENNVAWNQLGPVGSSIIVSGMSATAAPISLASGTTAILSPGAAGMPVSKYKAAGYVFDYLSSANYLILTGPVAAVTVSTTAGNVVPAALSNAITGTDAASIDTKMDDGVGTTGSVRGYNGVTASAYTAGVTPAFSLAFTIDVGST